MRQSIADLITAAGAVVDNWEAGDLAAAATRLSAVLEAIPDGAERECDPALLQRARIEWESEELVIDDDAYLARAADGGWITAWVWVPDTPGE